MTMKMNRLLVVVAVVVSLSGLVFGQEEELDTSPWVLNKTDGTEADMDVIEELAKDEQQDMHKTEEEVDRRVRRQIFPGTHWCGVGNDAAHYGDLGFCRATDACCRTHDQCRYAINAYSSRYGLNNRSRYTMSHCDCDRTLHNCLRYTANTVKSWLIDYVFFSALNIQCFEFVRVNACVQWSNGQCIRTELQYVARKSSI